MIFDFRETVFMDSAGIGMIMGRYKLMQALGGHVTAVHVSKRVRKYWFYPESIKLSESVKRQCRHQKHHMEEPIWRMKMK